MNARDLQRMYGSTPDSFQRRIQFALAREPKRAAAPRLRMALVTALVVMLTAAAAAGTLYSHVADVFGGFYGEERKAEILAGEIAQSGQSYQLDGAVFTLEEVAYIDNGLYGVGFIRPSAEDVVLLPEDWTELPMEENARILSVRTLPEAIGVDGGDMLDLSSLAYTSVPQPDGSIRFTFEIPTSIALTDGAVYTIRLWSSCQEVTPEGEWLESTYQGCSWEAKVEPKPTKEMK